MRRRNEGIVVLGLLVALFAADRAAAAIIKGPYLQNVQPEQATVMWETEKPEPGAVEFGPTAALGSTAADSNPLAVHEVVLKGLKPKTTYHYRVKSGGVTSAASTFTTAFLGEGEFTFAAYGDTRSGPDFHAQLIKRMRSWNPAFVIHTGDLVTSGFYYDDWEREFFRPAGPLLRTTCLWPALGNHEEDADLYYDFFSLPKPERWYTFRWGNARVIALDSERDTQAGGDQVKWLERELEKKDARWTFVFFHDPPYSCGLHGSSGAMRSAVVPLLEKHRVDLVFCGHNHMYERTYPIADGLRDDAHGVVYVTTAGGGAPPYPFSPRPWTAVATTRFHACLIKVNGSDLHLEAQDISGKVLDAFDRTKDGGRVARLTAALGTAEAAAAMRQLALLGATGAAPKMVAALSGKSDAAVRQAAAEALAQLNVPEGAAALAAAVKDPDPVVRRFAVQGLARTCDAKHLPAALAALDDPDEAVAAAAARGLAWMGLEQAVVPLARFIGRAGLSPKLREQGALALGQLSGGRMRFRPDDMADPESALATLLEDPDVSVAAEAAKALAAFNTPAARDAACLALERPYQPDSRAHDEFDEDLMHTLQMIADRSCVQALLAYVADTQRRWKNREKAAIMLDKLTGRTVQYSTDWTGAKLEGALKQWREALKGGQ